MKNLSDTIRQCRKQLQATVPGSVEELAMRKDIEELEDMQASENAPFFRLGARSSSVPLQRPPRTQHFMGRKGELAQLIKALKPGRVVTLSGPGGIGKSALAAEAIWTLTHDDALPRHFPHGVIWYDFSGEHDTDKALEHIVRSLRERPLSFGTQPVFPPFYAAKRALLGRKVLLLLDGAENADNFLELFTLIGDCCVIVTSRHQEDAFAERQDIGALETEEAQTLLQSWAKECADDDTVVRTICELLGGLPLAVRLAGCYLKNSTESATEYLTWLQNSPLKALGLGERQIQSVPLLMERSLKHMSAEAQQVLSVCGVLALSTFSDELLSNVLTGDRQAGSLGVLQRLSRQRHTSRGRDIRKALKELVNYGMLQHAEKRYTVSHALIHRYARKHLPVDTGVLERVANYYAVFARRERGRGVQGYARLDVERIQIMQVMEACKNHQKWHAVNALVWAMDSYFALRECWRERRMALEMGTEAARQLGNCYNEGAFLNKLGLAYSDLEQTYKAIEYYEQALAIQKEIGDRRGEGATLGNLGDAYSNLEQREKAIEYYEHAIAIGDEIGDLRNKGVWLCNLGCAYRDSRQVEKAIEYYESAITICREVGFRRGECDVLHNLGLAYNDVGQKEKTLRYLQEALAICDEMKSPYADMHREILQWILDDVV